MRAPALFVGLLGMILWGVGFASDNGAIPHQQAMYSYLFGFVFWFSVTIGCLGLMCVHGSLKATWGSATVRILEAGGGPGALLLMVLFFIPIAIPGVGLSAIYQWTSSTFMHSDPVLTKKLFYLTTPGFIIRTAIVVAIWFIWAALLKRSSRRQDESLDSKEWGFRSNWGTPGIVMFFLTITVISTDWIMSLEPAYFSTIYGLLFGVSCGLSALSLAVLIILYNSRSEPFKAIVNPKLTRDFGNLLFMLTMLWAYFTLAQFLITWEGNLPLEVKYYLNRTGSAIGSGQNHMDWNILSNLLIYLQFFVPFLCLLAPRAKRVVKNLIWVAMLIFVVSIFNVYWLIFPSVRHAGFGESLTHWTDYAAFLGIGGLWFAALVTQLTKAPLLPKYDSRILEAEHA